MRSLLIVTAAVEAVAGLALATSPSGAVQLLLGAPLDTLTGLIVSRVAGAALIALAVACWLARDDGPSRAATGLVAAMLLYNAAAAALLAYARTGQRLSGIALWPAVLLHVALAAWCITCLRRLPTV